MKDPAARPCPFCAGTRLQVIRDDQNDFAITFIACETCGAVTSFRGAAEYRDAIEAWNRRKAA